MAVPKKKTSVHKRGLRRGQNPNHKNRHSVLLRAYSKCDNCFADKIPHHVCESCGMYRGKQIITIKVKNKDEQSNK